MAGERILVIDDSPTITKVVQLVLTKAGYDVHTAADGEAGLAAVRSDRPDVILLDFVMPKMNGYQFCRELTADPKLRDIPVVLMSAKGDQVGERFVKVMGIVDYITKPFSPEAITAVVQHTVSKYGPSRTSDDTPSLVTGEDLAATDEADRAQARSTTLAQLRSSIADVVAAQLALARPTGPPRPRAATDTITETAIDTITVDLTHTPVSLTAAAPAKAASDPAAMDTATIAAAVCAALDDAALARVLGAIDLGLLRETAPGLRGDLRVVPLAEVLQLLDVQEQSGVLTVERSDARVNIFFRRGRVDQAIATGVPEEFVLGRFVLDAQLMQRPDFEAFLEVRTSPPKLIDQQLHQQRHLTEPTMLGNTRLK